MTKLIAASVAVVALIGTVGLSVVANNDGSVAGAGSGIIHRLHMAGQKLHGTHHDGHQGMAGVMQKLSLTPDQERRMAQVHETMRAAGGKHGETMSALHDQIVAQFERGRIDSGEIRATIDAKLEEFREMAYAVTDELIAFGESLDADQRRILLDHFKDDSGNHGNDH